MGGILGIPDKVKVFGRFNFNEETQKFIEEYEDIEGEEDNEQPASDGMILDKLFT